MYDTFFVTDVGLGKYDCGTFLQTVIHQRNFKKNHLSMLMLGQQSCFLGHTIFERSNLQTFWKNDCCAKFLFLELETSNFSYLLIFWFSFTVQSFRKIGQRWCNIFSKGPPFDVFWFCNLSKIQRGDPYKMSNINIVQYLWNFAQLKEIKK